MASDPTIQYFLGANSPGGFYSLYTDLLPLDGARAVYILKGGPGCGKSTLMRAVAARARAAGLETEQILCSGDPDSLDALILPQLRVAVADGTAPHVMEARCPGAIEHYVNLGSCYRAEGLYPIREALLDCKAGCQESYRRAYRCLEASAQLFEDARAPLMTQALSDRLAKRAKGILSRELPAKKGAAPGRVTHRFLHGPTCQGMVSLWDTAFALCPRVYQLVDSSGLGHDLLLHLLTGAVEGGYSPVACPDPMHPERLAHVLVPEAGVAFLTSPQPLPQRPYRRLRLDAMADREILLRNKPRLKFSRRVSDALLEEALSCLALAKSGHDELEALYHPHVDFDHVQELTKSLGDRIMALV